MTLKIKRLRPGAQLPGRATEQAAGLDLYAWCEEEIVLQPLERQLVPTGIAIELPAGSAGMVYARSGQALRKGLAMANGVGVIDADYRGEVAVPVVNLSGAPLRITHGERIAQLVVTPVLMPDMLELDTLSDTGRGEGGFGSTGTN